MGVRTRARNARRGRRRGGAAPALVDGAACRARLGIGGRAGGGGAGAGGAAVRAAPRRRGAAGTRAPGPRGRLPPRPTFLATCGVLVACRRPPPDPRDRFPPSAACACRDLAAAATHPEPWTAALDAALPGVRALLAAAPPAWLPPATHPRATLAALAAGLPFRAQVFNRELANPAEDFVLSAYDADVALARAPAVFAGADVAVAAAAAAAAPAGVLATVDANARTAPLPSGSKKKGSRGGRRGRGAPPPPPPSLSALPPPGQAALLTATYLPMGGAAAVEAGVACDRLRPAAPRPRGPAGLPSPLPLRPGDAVEVQWKAARGHPYGWWLGVVEAVHGGGGGGGAPADDGGAPTTYSGAVDVSFEQYDPDSPWRTVTVPLPAAGARAAPSAVHGNPAYGYVGVLRPLHPAAVAAWAGAWASAAAAAPARARARPARALAKAGAGGGAPRRCAVAA